MNVVKSVNTLDKFKRTREVQHSDELFELLCQLRPDKLKVSELAEIVQYIENVARKQSHKQAIRHANVFGTGGDLTSNISSQAAIIASQVVPVIKCGTGAVNSRFGSMEFFKSYFRLLTKDSPPLSRFRPPSRYLTLQELGFPYSENLRDARRRLPEMGVPDIYKVVFPFASYTNPSIQINGASSIVYFDILGQLAAHFERNTVLVRSELNVDELAPGRNDVFVHLGTRTYRFTSGFDVATPREFLVEFAEANAIDESVKKFFDFCAGSSSRIYAEVLLRNAALVAGALHMSESGSRPEQLEKIMEGYLTKLEGVYMRNI